MNILQLLFICIWFSLLCLSLYWIYQTKKITLNKKVFLSIATVFFPVFGAILTWGILHDVRGLPWQNSATKDDLWIAARDLNKNSDGDPD